MAIKEPQPEIDPLQGMRRKWTREEYYRLAEAGFLRPDEKVQLIGGEIIRMSPQSSRHYSAIRDVQEALQSVFGSDYEIRTQAPINLPGESAPEPDVAVVRGSRDDYRAGHPNIADLIVEVSDSSLLLDKRGKTSLYATAGIPEYWIVNLVSNRLEVYRSAVKAATEPFGYGYADVVELGASDTISPLAAPDARIPVAGLLPKS
jgi:Uma2 family endonuclease